MKLTTVHQLLIAAAMLLGAVYALRSLYVGDVGVGIAGVLLAGLLGLYLRKFRMKLRTSTGDEGAT